MRDLIFSEMTGEWKAAYEAGISPSLWSSARRPYRLDDKIYRRGMLDFQETSSAASGTRFLNDPEATDKRDECGPCTSSRLHHPIR